MASFSGLLVHLNHYILDFIYLDVASLARLQSTSKEVQRHCRVEQLLSKRLLHVDLTAPFVELDVSQDIHVTVLEVTVSHGLASRVSLLHDLFPCCKYLQHIHLRLVPDPGWFIAERVEEMDDAELLDVIDSEQIARSDGVDLMFAKAVEESSIQRTASLGQLPGCSIGGAEGGFVVPVDVQFVGV